MPPPSSGGVALVQIFGIFDRRFEDLARPNHNSPAYLHLLAEAIKHAFADRAEWLADPAFADVPTQQLIAPSYLDDLAGRVRSEAVLDDRFDYGTVTPGGTSHLSVIDSNGMAVACTETVNLIYGSLVYVPEFGIVLNNQMDDFTTDPDAPNAFGLRQSLRNVPEPGKRPLSSMSPTIVLKDGRAVAIAGASGGPRIISATAQALLNSLLFDMDARQAVSSPRVHHQWLPEIFYVEPPLAALDDALGEFGHTIAHMEDIGVVQLIRVHADGTITAASDPRKGGRPAGY
jgi:gamma-glutamyltranspeptidase / glutathione hydrolase